MNKQSMPDFIFEADQQQSVQQPEKPPFKLNDSRSIPRTLRSLGAAIIILSATSFLFQHWTPGSDLQRCLLLLGFTSTLSLSGLFCGLRLRESKGARTLLGLTLAVTPINFAVMGALLFSQFSWDGALAQLPGYATWVASSSSMALLTTAGGIVVLAPLLHFSFMTLGHKRAQLFSAAFLCSNLALLLPTRQPDIIAGVFMLLTATLTYLEVRSFKQETTLKTFEGYLSRGMLWIPTIILIGRGCYFYSPSQLLISAIMLAAATLCFIFLPHLSDNRSWKHSLQGCGAIIASGAWLNLAELLERFWRISHDWEVFLALLPISGLLYLLSKNTVSSGDNYRRAAAILAVLAGAISLPLNPSLQTALVCLLISASILTYGYIIEQKTIFFSGAAGTLFSLGYQLKLVIFHFSLTGWSSLMLIGVLIIISASLLERNSGILSEKFQHVRTQLNRWEK